MPATKDHINRIKQELKDAGATGYAMNKFSSKYLPNVIHPKEHIVAAVHGRYKEDGGLLNFIEGLLVATDRRIIFLDHKPGYTKADEVPYDMVSGIKKTVAGPFSSITLHTRVEDYSLRFTNPDCAERFMHYVEGRRIEYLEGEEKYST